MNNELKKVTIKGLVTILITIIWFVLTFSFVRNIYPMALRVVVVFIPIIFGMAVSWHYMIKQERILKKIKSGKGSNEEEYY